MDVLSVWHDEHEFVHCLGDTITDHRHSTHCVHAGQRVGVKTGQRASPLSGGRTASLFENALESLSETLGDARHRHALQRLIDAGLGMHASFSFLGACSLAVTMCVVFLPVPRL